MQKDPTQKKEAYNLTIQSTQPLAAIQKEGNMNILQTVVKSRCLTYQPTRTAKVVPYEGFRNCYKIVDYGDPKLSFYGILIIVAQSKTEVVEALEFDNLKDFYVVGEEPGKTQFAIKELIGASSIMLKRRNMTDEPFSFTSQYKAGRVVNRIPGGAGGRGEYGMHYLTEEDILKVRPPIEKTETKEKTGMTKEKMPMTKEKMPMRGKMA